MSFGFEALIENLIGLKVQQLAKKVDNLFRKPQTSKR